MADSVPISDVLSAAMEYLSKLGSNLRVRSENLKEKRLKKDKLRSVHDIQKAASKVLLICELSKKSLENVETDVKKILSHIDSKPSLSVGGKSNDTSQNSKRDSRFEYFEYESRELKIKSKINLHHYMSVKVYAKPMPIVMLEKYPLYHDCKLYRMRKKKESLKDRDLELECPVGENEYRKENLNELNNVLELLKCKLDTNCEKNKSQQDHKDPANTLSESNKTSIAKNKRDFEPDNDSVITADSDKNCENTKMESDQEDDCNTKAESDTTCYKKKPDSEQENNTNMHDKKVTGLDREDDTNMQTESNTCYDINKRDMDRADYTTINESDTSHDKKKRDSNQEDDANMNTDSTNTCDKKQRILDQENDDDMKNELGQTHNKKRRDSVQEDNKKTESRTEAKKKSKGRKKRSEEDNSHVPTESDTNGEKEKRDSDHECDSKSQTESKTKAENKKKVLDREDDSNIKSESEKNKNNSNNSNSDAEIHTKSENRKCKLARYESNCKAESGNEMSNCTDTEKTKEKHDKKDDSKHEEENEIGYSKKSKNDQKVQKLKLNGKNRQRIIMQDSSSSDTQDNLIKEELDNKKEGKITDGNENSREANEKNKQKINSGPYGKEADDQGNENNKHNADSGHSDKEIDDKVNQKYKQNMDSINFDKKVDDKITNTDDENTVLDSVSSENTSSESKKPFLKCVSLSKLLKPNIKKKHEKDNNVSVIIVSDNEDEQSTKSKEKQNIKTNKDKNNSKMHKGKMKTIGSSKQKTIDECLSKRTDEDYWIQKRKEVKKFKAKKFTITISRLPKLTTSFLEVNDLKRITKNGAVVCEIPSKSMDKSSDEEQPIVNKKFEQSVKTPQAREISPDLHMVKSSLLNDTDSDKSLKDSPTKPVDSDKIKSALLRESDSERSENEDGGPHLDKSNNESNSNDDSKKSVEKDQLNLSTNSEMREEQPKNSTNKLSSDDEKEHQKNENNTNEVSKESEEEKVKETDENKSVNHDNDSVDDSSQIKLTFERAKTPAKTSDEDETKIKSTLLNDSSDTQPKKQTKRKKSSGETPSKSRRKHIMESMHAKKELLTYSSSETEDEKLNEALKEIKNELLKGNSSSDNDDKNDKKNKKESSDIDDIIIKKRKKSASSSDEEVPKKKKLKSKSKNLNQIDGSNDQSDSSIAKMGPSRDNLSGSSNSDSKDPNDKDIDGLTNLNTLNKKYRRRERSVRQLRPSKKEKMPKPPIIGGEVFLQAESSSDAASVADSDDAAPDEVVDLPEVSLSGLNGDSIGHLAKNDLLGESDSSSSHKDNSDSTTKKEDESDEDKNVKSKRRKNAISSDSEAGSSRKKHGVRLSDFEDSDDENSEPMKKSKRKKKGTDSDASVGSSVDGSKKKRRRIKDVDDSEGSGSDTENEGRNKHGRKNIRKVMGKNQLEEATKKAAREEKERIARITERQKLYNNLEFDESGKPDEVVLEKVVLDFDPETKEPLIQVDRGLVKKLKPHQANGIKFMWDACFESVKRIKKDRGSGCILAHCMGLGKTLQVVSLTHTLLTHGSLTGVSRVLVVCPLSTVLNWVNEFRMWLKHAETQYDVDIYELSRFKQNSERAFQLQQWFEGGGVCVLGYEMFRNLSADNAKKFKKKMLRSFQESLVEPGPDLVVCDEGHLLKNEKTSLSQSMNRVRTRRRIVLTGTPLQNNLKEYYCMVQFVKPNLLGKYNEYLNRFVNPITNGQYTDSTEHDIRVMKRRSHVLHKMLDGAVQRRDYGVLAPFLPPKHEYVLFITLTEVQVKLYQHYLDNYSRRPLPGKSSGFLFPDFQSLQRIWTHPLVLKYNSERYEIMQQKKREREEEDSEGSLVDFIDDDSTPDESSTEESSDDLSDASDDSRKKSKKKKSAKKSKGKDSKLSTRRGTRANPVEVDNEEPMPEVLEVKNENPTEWWIPLVTDDEVEDMRNSHKLVLLFDILRQCETIGDKLLVFSQSLYSLDLIEHFLAKVDEATQEGRVDEKLGGHVGSWSPGVDYFRLDGSTSCENRSIWCKNFNRVDNPRARLFLISTRAGGLGINLVAANRVVIFDVSWNPSHDVQSIFRVYRFGQKKPCYVYRFLAMGTMEEKIYERQVTKQAISKRVIDEQQIDRHYAENDLTELYKFEPTPPSPRPLPPLPKDRLFAEMLKEHEAQIYKYHEHDSLLENKEEETLSEEERKAAWEDFENEKTRPPPAPFPAAYMGGLLAQQQQLAYAALVAMLRKEMPNITDQQVREMAPLLYNSNPAMFGGYDYGLMQKMTEIYKYAQPGMMGPGMMNPVMNPGGGAGLGGSSGLQYEPPWQRQQQQMRLQHMLQQQQNMGAKYYAGGLGSRDPVAMQLQQQRAREIMMGERGRPRGRPPGPAGPHAAHALPHQPPPAHHPTAADVVNLDSD